MVSYPRQGHPVSDTHAASGGEEAGLGPGGIQGRVPGRRHEVGIACLQPERPKARPFHSRQRFPGGDQRDV